LGVTVEIVDLSPPKKRKGRPSGAKLDDLGPEDDDLLRLMWGDQVYYTQAACVKFVEDKLDFTPTRQQLIYRYGNRN
jgi:hypothetical protein